MGLYILQLESKKTWSYQPVSRSLKTRQIRYPVLYAHALVDLPFLQNATSDVFFELLSLILRLLPSSLSQLLFLMSKRRLFIGSLRNQVSRSGAVQRDLF